MGRAAPTTWSIDDICRVVGWALLSAALLMAASLNVFSLPVVITLDLALIIALWLILRSARLFGLSDSTRHLLMESRADRKSSASHLHARPALLFVGPTSNPGLFLLEAILLVVVATVTASLALLACIHVFSFASLLALVAALALALVIAIRRRALSLATLFLIAAYLLLLVQPISANSLLLGMVLTVGCLFAFWDSHVWPLRFTLLLGGFSLIFRASMAGIGLHYAIPLGLLFLVYIQAAPFVASRRLADERETVRLYLGAAFVLGQILILANDQLASEPARLALAALPALLALSLGIVAWSVHARFSYAKYFWLIGLALLTLLAVFSLSAPVLCLLFFLAGIVILGLGTYASSHSSRQAGLSLMALAVLAYFGEQLVGADRLVVGLFLGLSLPIIAAWYAQMRLAGREATLRPGIGMGLQAGGVLVLFLLILQVSAGVTQSLLWMALGLATYLLRPSYRRLLATLGLVIFSLALIKLLLFDAFLFSLAVRFELGLSVCVLGALFLLFAIEDQSRTSSI